MKKIMCMILFVLFFCVCFHSTVVYATEPSSSDIIQGIDVSQWQEKIDFREVANSGIRIVYIKSSEGTSYVDPYFETNYKNAKENGLMVGVYHYVVARTVQEAEDEAQFFASTISGKSIDCKLAMDFENFGDLTVDEINEISRAFLNKLEELTGKETIIYSDAFNAKDTFDINLAQEYPLWVAEYGVNSPRETNWNVWQGFQYSDKGRINGITGNVDLDKFTNDIFLSDSTEIANDITRPNSSNDNITYVVRRGNTLSGIAIRFNTAVDSIAKLNNIRNINLIYVGQVLEIPAVNSIGNGEIHDLNHLLYTVKRGNTLSELARVYDTSVSEIVELNDIRNPNLIYVGEILRIY